MRIYFLGRNNDDKGTQLEILTKRILMQHGLTNVMRDEVGPGANEIDVTAEIIHNVGLSEIKIPVICECKAYDTAVTMPQWLKFLGKLYVEQKINSNTYGYFIALTDVNGNVWGHYKHLKEALRDTSVHLIGKDALIELLTKDYKLNNQHDVEKYAQQFTNKKIVDSAIIYYDNNVYWIIEFVDHDYTLMTADLQFITEDKYCEMEDLLKKLPFHGYIDIKSEHDSLVRKITLEGIVFCSVILGKNSIDEISEMTYQVCKSKYTYTTEEIIDTLRNNPFVTISDSITINTVYVSNNMVDFYRMLLERPLLPSVISSEIYQQNITEILLNNICEIQGGIKLTVEEKQNCLKILKLSAQALLISLTPDSFINNAMSSPYRLNEINKVAVEKYLGNLMEALENDFSKQEYWDEFHKKFDIETYSFSKKLVINAGKDNELINQDAPMVRFVQCDISGEKQTIPIIEFSNSQLKENK